MLSDASLYTVPTRTEVTRGQRRTVKVAPRLRLEVIARRHYVPRIVQAIERIPGASTYLQIIDAQIIDAQIIESVGVDATN